MIYLLRHGLDDESKIGGWSDVGLTKEGIKQIKEAKILSPKTYLLEILFQATLKEQASQQK